MRRVRRHARPAGARACRLSRMRLLVADDEALARRLIRQYTARLSGRRRSSRECGDTAALAAALVEAGAEAALLDVRMPGEDLFEVLAHVAREPPLPALVFATAYDRYAVRAFEVNAVDYLVKPFTAARLRDGDRARCAGPPRRGTTRAAAAAPRPRAAARSPARPGRRADGAAGVTASRGFAPRATTRASTRTGRAYLVYRTLNDLEARLDRAPVPAHPSLGDRARSIRSPRCSRRAAAAIGYAGRWDSAHRQSKPCGHSQGPDSVNTQDPSPKP